MVGAIGEDAECGEASVAHEMRSYWRLGLVPGMESPAARILTMLAVAPARAPCGGGLVRGAQKNARRVRP